MDNLARERTATTIGPLEFTGPVSEAAQAIFTPEACQFVADLARRFTPELQQLLKERVVRQQRIDAGELPSFLTETRCIREADWRIRGIPEDLADRRVEITGPVDRKMMINALNADVKVFMADFEDSLTPTWDNVAAGQVNMRDAVNRTITFASPDGAKEYRLNDKTAVLICRTRGLHLPEKHVLLGGQPLPGCLVDFGFYFFHNARTLLANTSGPYFYLPKLQSRLEAAWWADVFHAAEKTFGFEPGTIKATVLIETLPAAFEMDEILYAMRDHIVALNCGRWDYIFSYIKTLKNHPDRVLPDRQVTTMDKPFLDAYSRLLVQTCHHRGALAMGGMAAFIPSKDAQSNEQIFAKVREDKRREADNGHDGTWIAHPGLAPIANEIFDAKLAGKPNQLDVLREGETITAEQLLEPCDGERTEEGLRSNIRVAVQYLEAWISGNGCVPIYGLMEDAATAEISRASLWQWLRHGKKLSNGKTVTRELIEHCLDDEMQRIRAEVGEQRFASGRFGEAERLFFQLTVAEEFTDFLTLPAYELV